jgi:hypothetical protein
VEATDHNGVDMGLHIRTDPRALMGSYVHMSVYDTWVDTYKWVHVYI